MEPLRADARARGSGGADREPRGVAELYLDESVTYCLLAGVVVFLGVAWSLWGAFWLRRVELHRDADPTVRTLGLTWRREGLGPTVSAVGRVGAREVEVRWRLGVLRRGTRARIDGAWFPVDSDEHLRQILGVGAS